MSKGQYDYGIIGTGEARNFGTIGMGGRGVRFCTVAPNAEEVRSLLRRYYFEFKKLLHGHRG